MLGALAAVSTHYLVNFVGTLPVVRALVNRFIWWAEPKRGAESSDDESVGSTASVVGIDGEEFDDGEVGEDVEWVNMCMRKAWRVYQRGLERWLADLLQPVFDNLVADGMVPKFVFRLRIMEFTLDHEAPYFSNMRRRNSRKDSDLNAVVDVRYTGGARMLLLLEVGAVRWRVKVPIMVSDLDLECKMWLKIRLAPMCPYIGTLSLAFVGPPTIKVQLAPYNRVRLMRIPVLQPFLAKLLTVDLPALMTLPRRLEINIPPAVTAVAEAAVGRDAVMRAVASAVLQADALEHALLSALPLGPQGAAGGISLPDMYQGELQVALHSARDLPVWGFPWQSNPYCRLALGSQAVASRRDNETSQPSRHRAPVWNQEFQFLVEDPTVQALEIWVRDSSITGRTEVGYARMPLSELPKDGAMDVWLPVESSMPGEKTQGAIHVALTYKPFQDDDKDSGYREAAAFAAMSGSQDAEGEITDVKSAAAASSRAAVAASAAAAAVAVTKAAAARAAARLARSKRGRRNVDGASSGTESGSESDGDEGGLSNGTSNGTAKLSLPAPSSDSEDESTPPTNGTVLVGSSGTSSHTSNSNGNGAEAALHGELERAPSLDLHALDGLNGGGNGHTKLTVIHPPSSVAALPPAASGPAAQEEAVEQLELMAATMQLLTDEVQHLNASKADGADAAAAEAAAKAVAAAEALAVAAVVAGDVKAANKALQDAAAALEKTVVKFATGDSGPESVSRITLPTRVTSPPSSKTSPEERAAQALAAAQAAAAAAAAAVEAAGTPAEISELLGGSDIEYDGGAISSGEEAESLLLAADAIPSTGTLDVSSGPYVDSDGEMAEETAAPWWDQALRMVPGMPPVNNTAADALAEADGGAAGPLLSPEEGSADAGSGGQKEEGQAWWSGLLFWRRGEGGDGAVVGGGKKGEAVGGKEARGSQGNGGVEPVGDIILGSEIPIEEIAVEVQKSWKLRDRHVEALVQKVSARMGL